MPRLATLLLSPVAVEHIVITPESNFEFPGFLIAEAAAEIDAAERRRISSAPRATAPKTDATRGDAARRRPALELVLYVSSISPHSTTALRNLRRALAQHAGQPVRLTIHDLSKDPQRAERDGVCFTPSLVTAGLGPKTWIVGHLGNPQVLQTLIEAALEPAE